MPGIIDGHVHLGDTIGLDQNADFFTRENVEKDLRTYASYGVTAVLSMGTEKDLIFAMRDQQRTGRPREARIFTAGQGLVFKGGYGGVVGINHQVATDDEARAYVDLQAAHHVDIVKLWMDDELGRLPKMPYSMAHAIIDEAHKDHLHVVAHVFYLQDAKQLAGFGIDGFVHTVRDQPIDQTLIDAMKQHGTWQEAATLSREASMVAYGDPAALLNDPFFTRSLSPQVIEKLSSPSYQQGIRSNPDFSKYPQFLATAEKNFKTEVDAGIPYGCGTDSGPPRRFPGYFLHWEMELMVQAGLTPMQVLTACTRNTAEFLQASGLGTIEPGKWADFIVLDKNPLDDIKNTRTIHAVYIAGDRFH